MIWKNIPIKFLKIQMILTQDRIYLLFFMEILHSMLDKVRSSCRLLPNSLILQELIIWLHLQKDIEMNYLVWLMEKECLAWQCLFNYTKQDTKIMIILLIL